MTTENWAWAKIGGGDATYTIVPYTEFTDIFPPFENIKTLDDLEKNLSDIEPNWFSPTACYFEIDRESGIFYRDQQDCILWALAENGWVFRYQAGNKRTWFAKSLSEFLSHVRQEGIDWRKATAEFLRNLK